MTCALPAGLDIGLSQPPKVGTASRPTRSAQPHDSVEPESFGKILDNRRSLETDSEARTSEAAQVSPLENEAPRKTGSQDDAEWAPCAATPAQIPEPLVKWVEIVGSNPIEDHPETADSNPAPAEPVRPLETPVGLRASLPDTNEQSPETPESRPAVPSPLVSPAPPALAAQAGPLKTAVAAEVACQPFERKGLRAPEPPEQPSTHRPESGLAELNSGPDAAPAIEGILKPSRLDFHLQPPDDLPPEAAGGPGSKVQPQSVRRTVGEIRAMVRPEKSDSTPVRFSELPNSIIAPSAARLDQASPAAARTPQLAAPAETAGLRSMTRVEDLLQPASVTPAPLRSLNIQVEQSGRPVAVVHLEQQMAGLQVAVRSHAPAITEALRSELPQLVRSLQEGGIQSDFKTRAVASVESSASAASSMHSGWNEPGGEHREGPRGETSNWQQRERRQDRNDWREPVPEEDE